jgi:putative hemolysin
MKPGHLNLIFFIVLISNTSIAATQFPEPQYKSLKKNEYLIYKKSAYVKIVTTKEGNLTLSCPAKGTCQARLAGQDKLPMPKPPAPTAFDPGAAYCRDHHGQPVIAIGQSGDKFGYCQFQDMSYIDSWSLLFSHYPIKSIK